MWFLSIILTYFFTAKWSQYIYIIRIVWLNYTSKTIIYQFHLSILRVEFMIIKLLNKKNGYLSCFKFFLNKLNSFIL
jgi:hypothetical protein